MRDGVVESGDDFDENSDKPIHDGWTGEMDEYLKVISWYEDGNPVEYEMLTVVGNKPAQMEVDSQKDTVGACVEPSSESKVGMKRKTRIEDYFSTIKSVKKA